MKRILSWIQKGVVIAGLAGLAMGPAWAGPALDELREWSREAVTRLPGSPGNQAIQDRIGRLFEASGLPSGSMSFPTPVFVPGPATLEWEGQSPVAIHSFGPTLGRPGNFEQRDFLAPLVYLGRGETADWSAAEGQSLKNCIAVMEYGCGDLWMRFLRLGVRGFIFIGSDRYLHSDSVAKIYTSESAVPRYFIAPEEGARLREFIKGRPGVTARLRSEPSVWREATLQNHWVMITGQDPAISNEVAIVVAPIDSQSAVPGLAAGGQSAANLLLLTRLFDRLRQSPPGRSVLLAAVNGHTLNYLGIAGMDNQLSFL